MNQKDFQGNTAIHIAVIVGKTEGIKQAIEENPTLVNELNNVKETALHIAAWNKDTKAIELLVKAGAKLDHQDSKNRDVFTIVKNLLEGSLDTIKNEQCYLWLEMNKDLGQVNPNEKAPKKIKM
jgi:ankyrin repeat protein